MLNVEQNGRMGDIIRDIPAADIKNWESSPFIRSSHFVSEKKKKSETIVRTGHSIRHSHSTSSYSDSRVIEIGKRVNLQLLHLIKFDCAEMAHAKETERKSNSISYWSDIRRGTALARSISAYSRPSFAMFHSPRVLGCEFMFVIHRTRSTRLKVNR